jgi:hypothetical protein
VQSVKLVDEIGDSGFDYHALPAAPVIGHRRRPRDDGVAGLSLGMGTSAPLPNLRPRTARRPLVPPRRAAPFCRPRLPGRGGADLLSDHELLSLSIALEAVLPIPKVSIRQVKAARSLLAWSQKHLAEASGVSIPTLKRLEADDGELAGRPETVNAIRAALEAAGVEFTNRGGPGVKLKTKAAQGRERSGKDYV